VTALSSKPTWESVPPTMVGSFLWCLVLALESRQESFLLLDEEMLERSLGGSLD
jgi:hypothetical protein